MELTLPEQEILNGKHGTTLSKAMRSVVTYGETFSARRLVEIGGNPHMVTSFGANTIRPYFAMCAELIEGGYKIPTPFTVDPRPMDYKTLKPNLMQRFAFDLIFGRQEEYEKQLKKLGIRDQGAFSCACYLPEVANIPRKNERLAWSESSAVVFANSVLGARSNRNSAGIDLMCNILGKAPEFGLLCDEGRGAVWLVEIQTDTLPNAQLLGSAIGMKVIEDVPFITGLDRFFAGWKEEEIRDYLKDMGAAAASNGAVGLFHVENITPEAKEAGSSLLKPGYQTYNVNDAELERVFSSYPVLWKKTAVRPRIAFAGCPHASVEQIHHWIQRVEGSLKQLNRDRLVVPLYVCTAPDILRLFRNKESLYGHMLEMNLHLTPICPLMYMNNPLCARQPVATNSNKLRTYSTARFFLDDDLLSMVLNGEVIRGGKNG